MYNTNNILWCRNSKLHAEFKIFKDFLKLKRNENLKIEKILKLFFPNSSRHGFNWKSFSYYNCFLFYFLWLSLVSADLISISSVFTKSGPEMIKSRHKVITCNATIRRKTVVFLAKLTNVRLVIICKIYQRFRHRCRLQFS